MEYQSFETAEDLERIFEEWNEPLFRYVFFRIRNQEAAEDIVQQVFCNAWKYRHTFDHQKSSIKNWLYTIATNQLRHHFKNARPHEGIEFAEEIASAEDVSREVEQEDLFQLVWAQVKKLSEKDQTLLTLRYQQDMAVTAIAEEMKMEYSATKVALHRALEKLKRLCNEDT